MKISVDTDLNKIEVQKNGESQSLELYSDKAFEILSDLWSKVGWNQKYTYTFSWMGVPVIQLPEDMIRTQEMVWKVQPDVIIECGVAHGGGSIFLASLCKAMGRGRVIGVELEFRGENKKKIESHPLSSLITLVEGSSTAPKTVEKVRGLIKPNETVMVILDSNHSKAHVAAELVAYHDMITVGSYIVATDGCMEFVFDTPRGIAAWEKDNPAEAAREFVASHKNFVIDQVPMPFNESTLRTTITHWPDAWIRRVS
ncbi:MAG: CmcI family methyltransferase [Candidatus Peribacteraceae bacterium]